MLTLDVLGPVRLQRDGVVLGLTVKKSLALLLLLARGGSLPRARVVALLWPQLDESSARRNLRRELARLREAGAGDALHIEGDLLALAPAVRVDLHAFDAAITSGHSDAALALWRGPPGDGLNLDDAPGFNEWWTRECERLMNGRRRALWASAAACEVGGDAATALLHIEALLDDDPLQEQAHCALMRLLAALGRREAALAQFERCKRMLKDELGLAPMAETEALAAALRGAPVSLPAADAVRTRLLPELLPFVGRETEVAALEAAWGAGRTLLIEGEAGIGKSRLAIDFCAALGPYARVRSLPGDKAVPYATFTRGLRLLAGPVPDLSSLPAWAQTELSRLLPELSASAPPPLQSAAERSRFLEACTQGWLALATDSFDAVIFDDWHHADAASQSLLAFIAQRRRELADAAGVRSGARELLVYRPELDAEASATLQQLVQGSDALHLRLAALPDAAVLELVRRLSGVQQPTRFAARLHQATAGNPFFLAETLRHLTERELLTIDADGIWHTPFDEATQDYHELPVPGSVRETVLLRVQRLPAAAQRLLEAAALASEPFAPALLAPACALSEMDAVLGIEAAVEAQLLREHDSGGFAFAHDLVQQAIDASLLPDRRRLVHRRLALGAEAAGAAASVIALHHEASGDAPRAVTFRQLAGDAAQRLHAQTEAIGHWQQALADGATASQSLGLHVRLLHGATLLDDARLQQEQVLALQALAGSGVLGTDERSAALIAAAANLAHRRPGGDALELLRLLPADLSEHHRTQLMLVNVALLNNTGRVAEATATASEALALPGVQGQDRAKLLDHLVLIELAAGRYRSALEYLKASVALYEQLGDNMGVVRGMGRRGMLLSDLGDHAGAEAELQRGAALCERFGFVGLQRGILYNLCSEYSSQTRPQQVLEAAQQGWQLHPPMEHGGLRVMYRLAFVDAYLALGELGPAWDHAAQVVTEAPDVQEPAVVASALHTCQELLALLGESGRADPLWAVINAGVASEITHAAAEMWLVRAEVALLYGGDVTAAVRALDEMPAQLENERVGVRHRLVLAQAAAAQGRSAEALAMLLSTEDAAGLNDELRMRALALQVELSTRMGVLNSALVASAQAALAADSAHAVAALLLHCALAGAERTGSALAPSGAMAHCAAHVARLAHSLREHPVQQAAFLQRWR